LSVCVFIARRIQEVREKFRKLTQILTRSNRSSGMGDGNECDKTGNRLSTRIQRFAELVCASCHANELHRLTRFLESLEKPMEFLLSSFDFVAY
jgi:hypothetical protein